MLKHLSLLLAALAIGGVVCVQSAMAQPPTDDERPQRQARQGDGERGERKHDRGRRIMKSLFKGIELTDDQKQQVREIMGEAREEHKAWREEHKDEHQALREQMREARKAKDREKMKELFEQMRELRESAPKPDKHLDRIANNVLTADQREQFAKNRAEFREKMEQRRDKRRDRVKERLEGGGGDGDRPRPRKQRDRDGGDGGDELDI